MSLSHLPAGQRRKKERGARRWSNHTEASAGRKAHAARRRVRTRRCRKETRGRANSSPRKKRAVPHQQRQPKTRTTRGDAWRSECTCTSATNPAARGARPKSAVDRSAPRRRTSSAVPAATAENAGEPDGHRAPHVNHTKYYMRAGQVGAQYSMRTTQPGAKYSLRTSQEGDKYYMYSRTGRPGTSLKHFLNQRGLVSDTQVFLYVT